MLSNLTLAPEQGYFLSEIVATSITREEYQTGVSGNYGNEHVNSEWDDSALFNLVSANANVLVRVDRMGGAVMTLSDAMNAHPGPWTPENEPNLIAEVYQLLANQVTEPEEPEKVPAKTETKPAKEQESNKKNDAKTEADKVQIKADKVDAKKQTKNGIEAAKRLEFPARRVEKAPKPERSKATAAKVGPKTGEDPKPVQAGPKESSPGTTKTETLTTVKARLYGTEPASKSEVKPKQQAPIVEMPAADPVVKSDAEAKRAPDMLQSTADLEIEADVIADYAIELEQEITEETEDEPILETLDYPIDAYGIANLIEDEEVSLDHLDEVSLESDELYGFSNTPTLEVVENNPETLEGASIFQLDDESNRSWQAEITSQEQLVQTSSNIEEIEDSLIQLAERIDDAEPETAEKVNEILDKIIEVPAKLEDPDGGNVITEAEAQEELEELFTELLDQMGIDYTPELIESLAYLTIRWRLTGEIEKPMNEEELDETPQDTGTHEIIKLLLSGSSNINRAMARADTIGRSALRLTFNLAA